MENNNQLRILHLGLCAKSESLPRYFREVATVYDEYQPHEAVDNGKSYDICFMQIQNEKTGNGKTVDKLSWVKRLKDEGCKVISWTGDKRQSTPRWMVDFAPNVSITCFSNMEDVEYFRSLGLRSEFLQIGIDEQIFKPEGDVLKVPEVIFLANNYGNQFPLSGFRRDLVHALNNNFDFGVYGNGWKNAKGNLNTDQYEEAKAYRGCKIAISASHFNSERYTSDRLLRIIGCGAFCMVHDYNTIEKDFKIGQEMIAFHSVQDCVSKVGIWLKSPHRETIANNAHKASKRFTYKEMINNIIKM